MIIRSTISNKSFTEVNRCSPAHVATELLTGFGNDWNLGADDVQYVEMDAIGRIEIGSISCVVGTED